MQKRVKNNSTKEITFKKEGELQLLKASNDSLIKRLRLRLLIMNLKLNRFDVSDSMNKNHGMLFIFPNSQPRSFYMKNTRFSLDIIYIDENKTIVSFQENANPLDESSLPSTAAAKYVLELNAGLVKSWGVQIGDKITYRKL